MKFNVSLTLRMAVAAAIAAVSANAYAFGGLFDSGLYKNISDSSAVVDDSFFAGEALTFGNMSAANFGSYELSAIDEAYGDCAECQGAAPIVESGVAYEYPAVSYGYVDSYGWTAAPATTVRDVVVKPVHAALKAGHNVLRGVRRLLCRSGYDYCQPAYVCDPCWNICDSCDWTPCAPIDACQPCAPACDPCAPMAVYAPAGCCGYGYAPGETRPLNPETGKPSDGLDATVSTLPEAPETKDSDIAPANVATPGLEDDLDATPIDSYDSDDDSELVPTPAPINTGAGLIKMLVPEDSVVYVNGYRTKQSGAMRTFAAKDLQFGETYSFEIRVVAVRNGRTYEDVQTTTLTAGDSTAMAFNLTLRENQAYAYNN